MGGLMYQQPPPQSSAVNALSTPWPI